jgi:hypothetical protein
MDFARQVHKDPFPKYSLIWSFHQKLEVAPHEEYSLKILLAHLLTFPSFGLFFCVKGDIHLSTNTKLAFVLFLSDLYQTLAYLSWTNTRYLMLILCW